MVHNDGGLIPSRRPEHHPNDGIAEIKKPDEGRIVKEYGDAFPILRISFIARLRVIFFALSGAVPLRTEKPERSLHRCAAFPKMCFPATPFYPSIIYRTLYFE